MSRQPNTVFQPSKSYDDDSWIVEILEDVKTIEENHALHSQSSHRVYCICHVPESLLSSNPDAFIPKFVGLGPFHHFRAEPHITKEEKMEKQQPELLITKQMKLGASKRLNILPSNNQVDVFQQSLKNYAASSDQHHLFDFYHPDIKSAYEDRLQTLLYVLTIDGFFLLALLQLLTGSDSHRYAYYLTGTLRKPLLGDDGEELTRDALIREVFMLENQIPFEFLLHIRGIIFKSSINNNSGEIVQSDDDREKLDKEELGSTMLKFCQHHCPFVVHQQEPSEELEEDPYHLLHLMYRLIVPDHVLCAETEAKAKAEAETKAKKEAEELAKQEENAKPKPALERNPKPSEEEEFQELKAIDVQDKRGCCFTCCSLFINIFMCLVIIGVILVFIVQLILKLIWWVLYTLFRIIRWTLRPLYHLFVFFANKLNPMLKSLHDFLVEARLVVLVPFVTKITGLLDQEKSTEQDSADDTGPGKEMNEELKLLHATLTDYETIVPSLNKFTKIVGHLEETTRKMQDSDSKVVGPPKKVMIPSVTELKEVGISLEPAKEGGISNIEFDEEKCVFYLPSIMVNANSEVIMRNLIAYETLTTNGPLVFSKYIELMRAIIDTAEDVKILVHKDIIHTDLTNEDVEKLFNRMTKSIRRTRTPKLDEEIKKVNKKFERKQQQNKVVNKFKPGKMLTGLAGFIFLALTAMQTVCSIYNCSGTFKLPQLPQEYYGSINNSFISSM